MAPTTAVYAAFGASVQREVDILVNMDEMDVNHQ